MLHAWKLPWLAAFLAASALAAHLVAWCFADPINRALRRRAGIGDRAAPVPPSVAIAAPGAAAQESHTR
jgi:peptidoglycan/LPS O-acetylase OafA/YrhL